MVRKKRSLGEPRAVCFNRTGVLLCLVRNPGGKQVCPGGVRQDADIQKPEAEVEEAEGYG